MYINCHSYYSFKYGTMSPEKLVFQGVEEGIDTLVLTDINNISAAFNFYRSCREKAIKPIIGIEFRNEIEGQGFDDEALYVGIAKNNQGFAELNSFLSHHHLSKTPLPIIAPDFSNAYVIYELGKREISELKENEFLGVRISELNRLMVSDLAKKQDKLVMLHPITFKNKIGYNTHRLLRTIDKNTILSKVTEKHLAAKDEIMLPIDKLISAYSRFPKIIDNTNRLLQSCSIEFDSSNKNKKFFTSDQAGDKELLQKLALDGLKERYGSNNKAARERMMKELEVINSLSFNAYFLITWDIIRYAVSRGFSYVGRGSGANSIVAYCLKITDVDPIELNLYFERFLNKFRTSPPDFDIDFAWNERDEIIDYIIKRYGAQYTVLLASYNTFKERSSIRELGKVYGLPDAEIEQIVSTQDFRAWKEKKEAERKVKKKEKTEQDEKHDKIVQSIFFYAQQIEGFPNHLSIHAGGILISEYPITNYTALNLPPKGFPTTQFDMFVAEDMGFYKYDILSQRGLGHIKEATQIIEKNTGKRFEYDFEKAKNDEKVRGLISTGDTIGAFYIESPAMRMLLKKLKCSDYLTLVAASSIIRPGVAQSGMMQSFIKRFHKVESPQFLHPKLGELLEETFGVMVYQEDVIKVAHHFGGLDLGEADILRRAMSGKYKGSKGFDLVKEKFFTSCRNQGHEEKIIAEVWRQMESFAGYSFSKAHSASFAVESYHSLYLKAYYPLEFMVAVLNNEGGFYSRDFYINEARRLGADIQAPCVNNGVYLNSIIGNKIYIGFRYILGLEKKIAPAIELEREVNGNYKDFYDFIKRIPVTLEQVTLLIRTGAFRFTGKSKQSLLLEASLILSKSKAKVLGEELFSTEVKEISLPVLDTFTWGDEYDEIELLKFPVCYPFEILPEKLNTGIKAKEMLSHAGRTIQMVGYFVALKETYTKQGHKMAFAHFLDREGNTFDTTHFHHSYKKYRFYQGGFYKLIGKIADEFGHPSMEVEYMIKLPIVKKEVRK
jgi:DNA-directed DNA polymerase III PolC